MKTDLEIANEVHLPPISEQMNQLNLNSDEFELYGRHKAKLHSESIQARLRDHPNGHLILVTAINPTPAGEGKTTTSIGLADGLRKLGKNSMLALREPSLGPVFGLKGGATGGGYAQVAPMADINLHFTGDLHAITAANNLCSAIIDNHIFQENKLRIDPKRITWKRCMDLNDRGLRSIVMGLGSSANGIIREDQFQITVASEVMAMLCLATSFNDLKQRLARTIVAYNDKGDKVTIHDLGIVGAMATLLKDAFLPNLVQTLEGCPTLIHGGPFANIAHGCNSINATNLALKLADYVVTEAGFGADLGAEKFLDIKCRVANLKPDTIVLVATIRALKYNGGQPVQDLATEHLDALKKGISNLKRHIKNLSSYHVPIVVAINSFHTDTEAEYAYLKQALDELHVPCALSTVHAKGGHGGTQLAEQVLNAIHENENQPLTFPYELEDPIEVKIQQIATKFYGAAQVTFQPNALKMIEAINQSEHRNLPICMAKTQYSFSDDPLKLGAPTDFTLTIRDVQLCSGAGFIVCYAGSILTMPGLPKQPAALNIDIDEHFNVSGLF